jgi:hypothetical protein
MPEHVGFGLAEGLYREELYNQGRAGQKGVVFTCPDGTPATKTCEVPYMDRYTSLALNKNWSVMKRERLRCLPLSECVKT